jgi:hypothetical protein
VDVVVDMAGWTTGRLAAVMVGVGTLCVEVGVQLVRSRVQDAIQSLNGCSSFVETPGGEAGFKGCVAAWGGSLVGVSCHNMKRALSCGEVREVKAKTKNTVRKGVNQQ